MSLLLALACRDPVVSDTTSSTYASRPSLTETTPDVRRPHPAAASWGPADPGPTGPWTCAVPRAPDFADWPGGLRMELTAGDWTVGATVEVSVRGATPGDVVELYAGALCTLDCPDPDGACFQPAAAERVGEAVADASGAAQLSWTAGAGWAVLQAAVPAGRYLSRPWVDRPTDEPYAPIAPYGGVRGIGPATIRHLETWGGEREALEASDLFTWPVAAGRGAALTVTGEVLPLVSWRAGDVVLEDTEARAYRVDALAPGRFTLEVPEQVPGTFEIDARLEPLAVAADWFPDGDGDGWGDAAGLLVSSAAPVAGASVAAGDCDDADPARSPVGREACGDGVDQDCDGADRPCGLGDEVALAGTRVIGAPYAQLGGWIRSGDLDGDGLPELVGGSAESTILAAGVITSVADRVDQRLDPGWSWPPSLPASSPAAIADLTGDGQVDLVVADDTAARVYPGPRGPGDVWAPVASVGAAGAVVDLAAGQLDEDGAAELVVTLDAGEWQMFAFTDPLADPEPVFGMSAGGNGPALVDLDRDGIDEILSGDLCRWRTLQLADFACLADPNLSSARVFGADVDGDGGEDALFSEDFGRITVIGEPWGDRASLAAAGWAHLQGVGWAELAAFPDASGPRLAGSDSSGTWLLDVDGPGTYAVLAEATYLVESDLARPLVADDWDGDGAVDLAIGFWLDDPGDAVAAGSIWVLWGS